ncbi:MAG: aspartate aminotransferase family protein [Dongiaceae bacterium]
MTSWAGIAEARARAIYERERGRFEQSHPKSHGLAAAAKRHLHNGVPMGWMTDWASPYPIFAESASGASIRDVDGNSYADFCLGDTGSMFGHSPEPIVRTLKEYAGCGLTYMLPTEDAVVVGELLSHRFGLPFWQVATTATDANRFVLRLARAVTGRPRILVFNGCYHGTVDDTYLRLVGGRQTPRPGLLGQAQDLTEIAKVVEFNDLQGLEAALIQGDIAAVICEPAMTNIGMVQPDPEFHHHLRALTRQYGTLLVIDETHTISTGPGGYTHAHRLEPDFFTLGKPIAGGIPCAVYGFTAEVAERIREATPAVDHGHTGIGTTLSANALSLRLMRVNLEEVMTPAAYAHMEKLSGSLADGLAKIVRQHRLPWHVTRVGARAEFVFTAKPPRNGSEAEAGLIAPLERTIHLYLINRGVMIAPFHNMTLCCPATSPADLAKLHGAFAECLDELTKG